ncbi:MAG TPA: PQQ-binding-like beta-propeller repeat protein [Solirubrobacteraceae bacterium]|jgi:outer membrane protein assembly factor BamB
MPSRSRQVKRAQERRTQTQQATRTRQARVGPPLWQRVPKWGWLAGAALVVVIVVVVLAAALGSSSSSSGHASLTGSGYPNFDTSNSRRAGGPIDGASVSKLAAAWTMPLTARSAYGSYSSSPIISDGVIYSQDLASNVQAIDLKTGKVIWTKSFNSPDQGPNGLVVQGGRVFGATATSAFALNQGTGKELWSVALVRNAHEGIDMAPGYHDGIVYIATVPGNNSKFYGAEGVGVLWALDAGSGKKLWHFDTVPRNLWGNSGVNSGGGLWYTPAFDEQGSMYVGVANPAPFPGTERFPWGSSRPGPNLYSDAIVKLNAKTGKLQWYYQQTPHDLYDWDLQDPPILSSVHGKPAVIAAGKSGFVVALDRSTGKVLWKRSVGIHNGHDQDPSYALKHEYSKLHTPETVYPGLLGGVIAPMASNGSTVFVPVVNHPVTFNTQSENQESGQLGGELVALDTQTGAVKWYHPFSSAAFGAATVVNDLVFATSFEGKLYAFDTSNGSVVWEKQLPAGTNTGITVSGDTLIAAAGTPLSQNQSAELIAYRLGG